MRHVAVVVVPQIEPQDTELVGYHVIEDHDAIVVHRDVVHDPVGGGVTIHELKLYHIADGVSTPTHQITLQVTYNHPHDPV